MKTYSLAPDLKLIDVAPPIPGFNEFISVYVLEAKKIALIDVGPSVSVDNLMSGLAELNISPTDISYVFATHIHIDHAGGIGKAVKQMPNAMVLVHEKGAPHLVEPARLEEDSQRALGELALKYGPLEPVPQDQILVAKEGMLLDLGGMEIEVLSTPGHASHHLSFLDRKEGRLFVGEAAGVYVGGSVRPAVAHPFNLEQALTSLDKLIRLNPASLYYCHFGGATPAVDKLNHYKQQLILWGNIMVDCLEKEASWEDMYNEIRKKDNSLDGIDSLTPDQYQRELFFITSGIRGFAAYFQRYGTEYIKQYKQ